MLDVRQRRYVIKPRLMILEIFFLGCVPFSHIRHEKRAAPAAAASASSAASSSSSSSSAAAAASAAADVAFPRIAPHLRASLQLIMHREPRQRPTLAQIAASLDAAPEMQLTYGSLLVLVFFVWQ
jgi:hypothetical protein